MTWIVFSQISTADTKKITRYDFSRTDGGYVSCIYNREYLRLCHSVEGGDGPGNSGPNW